MAICYGSRESEKVGKFNGLEILTNERRVKGAGDDSIMNFDGKLGFQV